MRYYEIFKGLIMPKKLSLYLDTSVFSAYYDENNLDRMIFTQEFFSLIQDFDLFTSDLAIEELSAHPLISAYEF